MAVGEAEEILRALAQAEERRGTAERRARTYAAQQGVIDQTNRDLRLLVQELAGRLRDSGKSSGS